MTKASDLFIQCLEEEGVEYIFGVPGEENLDFLDSLSRSTKIKLILTRHEQGAGFMAATYGRHTGKTGVCLATLGPGATNFVTAAAYAQLGGMPILMVTGQKPIKKSKQGRFQILDVVDMMGPITKFTHQLASADNIPSRVREAFRLAEEEKPGATHIEFPEDIADEQTDCAPLKRSHRPPPASPTRRRSAPRSRSSRRRKSPVLVIGAGANRKMTSRMLLQFIEKTGIPFVTTQLGKGVIDETPSEVPRLRGAVGRRFRPQGDRGRRPDRQCRPRRDREAALLHEAGRHRGDPRLDPHRRGRSGLFPADRGDRRHRQRDLADEGGHRPLGALGFRQDAGRARGRGRAHRQAWPTMRASRSSRPAWSREVREAMPADGIICLDNGVYKIWFARNYPARQPNTVLLDNALATMGAGLPSRWPRRWSIPTAR